LPAAVVPVLVGTGLAVGQGHFRPVLFLLTLVASLLIQIGTNFANDYYDFKKGADTVDRIGPARITSQGLVGPRQVLMAALVTFGVAVVIGLVLVYSGGVPILIIGVASIAAGIAYTGGPYPLGYNGLGDVFTFIFFGVVAVVGTYYLQTGTVTAAAFMASLPVAFLVTAILVVNNVRDVDTDRKAGKMTLAARFGRRAARREYAFLVIGSYVFPLVMLVMHSTTWYLFWLPLVTIPIALGLVSTVSSNTDGPALNKALKGTGQLHMLFGLLFAISLLKH
jgi:1,4-dihydroxy-2-naphthoate octaprenyltransferase